MYDPFARGPHPVGVRTVELVDEARGRRLPTEVWYPADATFVGQDLAPATRDRYVLMPGFPEPWQRAVRDAAPAAGRAPLVIFSHGFGGHRRQSTFFTTHLASHGYAVVSPDHTGNTFVDLLTDRTTPLADRWRLPMGDRPRDVTFLIDALGAEYDAGRVAITGHSFGGWTSVRAVADEPRIAAVVALSPAMGMPGLRQAIDLAWTRDVPTLVITGEVDSIVPLDSIERTFAELRAPADLVVVARADHLHFCDNARLVHEQFRALPMQFVPLARPIPPFADLAPAEAGTDAACGLGLAHLDAHLRGDAAARAWLEGSLSARLAARGIEAREVRR